MVALVKVIVSGADTISRKPVPTLSLERCRVVTTKNLPSLSTVWVSTAAVDEVCTRKLVSEHRCWIVSSESSASSSPIPADNTEEWVGAEKVDGKQFEGDLSASTSVRMMMLSCF